MQRSYKENKQSEKDHKNHISSFVTSQKTDNVI